MAIMNLFLHPLHNVTCLSQVKHFIPNKKKQKSHFVIAAKTYKAFQIIKKEIILQNKAHFLKCVNLQKIHFACVVNVLA